MSKKTNDIKKTSETPTPNLMSSFVIGARKGMDMSINSLIPNIAFAFTITRILQLLGIIDLIGNLLSPLMGIFGLPGEAAVPIVVGMSALAAGFGSAVSLAAANVLSATDIFMIMPTMLLTGGIFIFTSRILMVTKIKSKDYKIVYIITILNGIIALFAMKLIINFI